MISAVGLKLKSPALTSVTTNYDRRFMHNKYDCNVTIIYQGQLHICEAGEAIYTLLGSCIAVCVRDVKLGFGGMNHFLLPASPCKKKSILESDAARYGDWSMEMLLNGMYKVGSRKQDLEIKIFGGGDVSSSVGGEIGGRNAEFVREYLYNEGIDIAGANTGGTYSRKVYYFPGTGKVKLKRVDQAMDDGVAEREIAYLKQLKNKPQVGGIELF